MGREPGCSPVRWLEEAGLGGETCQAWSHSSREPEVVRQSPERKNLNLKEQPLTQPCDRRPRTLPGIPSQGLTKHLWILK